MRGIVATSSAYHAGFMWFNSELSDILKGVVILVPVGTYKGSPPTRDNYRKTGGSSMASRPFIPAPNCSQIELIFQAGTYYMENVLHTRKGSPFTLEDLQAQRAVILAWESATGKGPRSNTGSLVRVKSKALDTAIAPVDDYLLPSPIVGSTGGALLTLATTFAVKLTTDYTGRSARGRVYIAGLGANALADGYGNVTSTFANLAAAAYNTLKTNLAAAGYTFIVLSYRTNKAWRSEAQPYDVVNATYTDVHVDVQRRRMPGRGQ